MSDSTTAASGDDVPHTIRHSDPDAHGAADDAGLVRDRDDPSKWPVFVDANVDTDPLFANGPAISDAD